MKQLFTTWIVKFPRTVALKFHSISMPLQWENSCSSYSPEQMPGLRFALFHEDPEFLKIVIISTTFHEHVRGFKTKVWSSSEAALAYHRTPMVYLTFECNRSRNHDAKHQWKLPPKIIDVRGDRPRPVHCGSVCRAGGKPSTFASSHFTKHFRSTFFFSPAHVVM